MKFNKNMLILYAITDRKSKTYDIFYDDVKKAIEGGATIIQLREKNVCEELFTEEAIEIRKLCNTYNVPLIINDNLSVAIKSGADGIHVGNEDMSVDEIRKRVPKDFIIGATAKTPEQAQRAEKNGADYLGVGAIFPSPTKQDALRITPEKLKEITSSVSIPVVAIGGITAENVSVIKGCGACGIAVISAIFGAKDITEATKELKERVKEII